jgi:timeless
MVSTTTHHRAASSAQQAAGAASSPKPAQSTAATVAAASRGKRVTPGPPHQDLHSKALQDRMTVDKNVVNELLLVCGVIGTTEQQHEDNNASSSQQRRLVPVTDCLEWLQDLQRAIRRDDDLYRPISIWMAHHNVVQHKLLPLTMHSRADTALVLTACKILVILTKPLSENAIRAGQRVLDPHKTHAR